VQEQDESEQRDAHGNPLAGLRVNAATTSRRQIDPNRYASAR
jgi:hypothetical protein